MNGEIIKALRATKEHLTQDAGFDIRQLIETIQEEVRLSAKQGPVILQPPPENRSDFGFQQIRFAKHRMKKSACVIQVQPSPHFKSSLSTQFAESRQPNF
jgi:hypothetical protein